MDEPLRILILEDNPADAELIQYELREAGLVFTAHVVMAEEAYLSALRESPPDLILSDYNLHRYSGRAALAEARTTSPEIPFIFVTGAITEVQAIDTLTSGARDFVMKSRLQKLVPAVTRALAEAQEHKEREQAKEDLRRTLIGLEAQVEKRTAELQAVLDAAPIAIWIAHDPQCRLITGNTYADEIIMKTARGSNISLSAPPGEETVSYRVFREGVELKPEELPAQVVAATGIPVTDVELELVFSDGRRVHLLEAAVPLFDANGRVSGVVITGSDITKRKQVERKLQQVNDSLEQRVDERTAELRAASLYSRSLIEASLDPLVTISPEGKIMDVNRATEQVTGKNRGELIGTDFSDYFTEPDAAQAGYRKVLAEGQVRDYPLAIRHTSGNTTDVLYNATVYRNEQGEVQGVFAAARDITDRKRAEEALKGERQRLYDVLDTLPVYVLLLTPEHHVPFANRFFEERYGSFRGRRCFESLFERTKPCEICETYTVLETMLPHQWEWTGPDGRIYDIFDFPFIDTDGSTIVMEVGVDITERKQAEEALQKSHDELELRVEERTQELKERTSQLEAANRELESFSYSISHDLRAPLRAINGYSRLLVKKYGDRIDEDATRRLNVIQSSAQFMGQLIEDLLSFSRLGRQDMRIVPIDLEAMMRSIWMEIQEVNADRWIDFSLEKMHVGYGDPALVRQVLVNLLSNAVKFTKDRKPAVIEVRSYRKDGEIVYCVRDNGIGFDMNYADKLFGVFQRLHSADEYEGTGVGLAIVQRIVHRHGGRVWAEGKVGEGSTFYFTLPAGDAPD